MPACINGFVLELNARLVEQPELLVTAPLMEGFLAVINPSAKTTLAAFKKIHAATSGETLLEEGE
ncbi:hypothetical protein STCU_02873 [Strigomonas culicis]|uniref:Uncharacterized protein n=1 Tax=Strigomonas culicis TaxID=28005 RepID=S9UU26_9TRYP|nr:hypothetical protein STCU_02873 [Strigomonas culicis]|eukprot:EPY32314.1 hypothetical protein STCU_02873 [Strigomonas culicis]